MGVYRCLRWKCWTLRPKFCLWLKITFFLSLNHLQIVHQMIGGGFTFWLGGKKNLHTRHKYFFEISIPRAKQTWEFPRDVMTKHETQALKQGRVGSNPGNQTSSTKIGGERYIGENPSELLRNFGCSEIWENCSRRHRNFAAFLTSFCFPILKQQWRDGGVIGSDR